MRVVLFTILLAGGAASIGRLKRQALPSNHVQVHSLNSNVSVSDVVVVVTSSDSRIDLLEKKLNLSTWATSSNVSFDTFDTFVNYTAVAAETFARMQGVELHAQAANSEFAMTTNKQFDSSINNSLTGRVNVSIADSGMKIQALEGKWADVTASTREANNTAKSMNIYSNMSLDSNYERRLVLSAVDRLYDMEAILLGARVRTTYGDVMIDIDPDYRTARIYTNAHTIELKTTLSPFGIEFNNQRMLISAPFEETTATILKNSSDVHFIVGQLSQLRLSRGGGEIQLGGNRAQADRINVTSNSMNMDLFSTREMDARTNQSHISMMTNSTTASLTSLTHHLHVSGGVPQMALYTGNLTINISTKPAVTIQPTLFPGFTAPPDKFANVGPKGFPGDGVSNGQFSRATSAPGVDGSTGGEEVTVVTEGGTIGGEGTTAGTNSGVSDAVTGSPTEETERTVGYRTPSPETTGGSVETTLGEVIGVSTINPVEGGNTGGDPTTEAPIVVSSDFTLPPTQGELTTEPSSILSTNGVDTAAPTDGQVTGGETAGETTQNAEATTQSVIGEGTISVPSEVVSTSVPPSEGGEVTVTPVDQTTVASGEQTTVAPPVGETTVVGGGEVTTAGGGELTTLASGEQTTAAPSVDLSTVSSGGETTVGSAEGEVTTVGFGDLTTVASGDSTTVGGGEVTTVSSGGETTVGSAEGEATTAGTGELTTVASGEATTGQGEGSVTTVGGEVSTGAGEPTTAQVVQGEASTIGAGEATTLSAPVEGESSTAAGQVEGQASTVQSDGQSTDGGVASTLGGEEATTPGLEVTTLAGEGVSSGVTEGEITPSVLPQGEITTAGGDSTDPSVLLTTVLTIDGQTTGQTIPSDFPTPITLSGVESSSDSSSPGVDGGISTVTPESGASGDSTTGSSVIDQSTPGGDIPTPGTLLPEDLTTTFVTPGTLLPEDFTTTDDFAIAQYSTDSIPEGGGFDIYATISGVQLPASPTPLVAEQRIETDFPDPEALTSLEKRSPISRTETFRVRLRSPRKVNASDSSFTRELSRNVIEIANRTLESTHAIADRRKRNIEVDPIILNVTDVSQVADNEAEVRFAVGLHSFDDIDSLIDALKRSIPNGTENGIVIIERIEVYATINHGATNWILPVILIITVVIIIALGFLAFKLLSASALLKGLPSCCDRSPRIADSASFRSFS